MLTWPLTVHSFQLTTFCHVVEFRGIPKLEYYKIIISERINGINNDQNLINN